MLSRGPPGACTEMSAEMKFGYVQAGLTIASEALWDVFKQPTV